MKKCPECQTENDMDDARFCNKCGAPLAENTVVPNISETDDDLDFEVTEAIQSEPPQLFGNQQSDDKILEDKKPEEENLEIEDNANLLSDSSIEVTPGIEIPTDKTPINNPEPEKLPNPEPAVQPKVEKPETFTVDWGKPPKKNEPDLISQVNDISASSEKIPSADEFLKKRTEIQQNNALQSPSIPPVQSTPIKDNLDNSDKNEPLLTDSKITKSSRVRGIAYFYKNIVQFAGNPFLHENDEVFYKDKPYRLKPYKISKRAKLISIAAVFFILSIAIGSQIIGPALPGEGQIVGIVLDENGQPFLGGASVYIPELDKSVTSNALGFFRFDDIPTGSYELIYKLGDDLEGRENVTVTSGSFTMRSFGDFNVVEDSYEYSSTKEVNVQRPAPSDNETVKKAKSVENKQSKLNTKSSSGFGKIKLAANVDGAKLVVDGETLGAGNNTFTKIKTGKRKIEVSKPGYTDYVEIVTVLKNKTQTVKANLSRKATDNKEALTANDYLELGNDAFVTENYNQAVVEYTKAIQLSPNNVDAYGKRAQAYVSLGENAKATTDYIRLGEIYSFKNQNGSAISQFTSALKYSKDNTVALAGRASARMGNGEYRSALIDYTRAVEIDDDFYPAQLGAGIAEFKLGDNKNAEKYLKNAKKLNQSDPQLYHYLMLNYLARDNIKQVKKTYAQYKSIAPSTVLAEFKSSSQFAPVIRLIGEENL